jgi:AbrB family looped-hinge helix DNA binding protein
MVFYFAKSQSIMVGMLTKLTIDKLGRIVLPKPVREKLQLSAGDELELESLDDRITLRPVRGTARLKKTRCPGLQFRRATFGRKRPGDHRASAPRTRRYQSGAAYDSLAPGIWITNVR